MSRVLLLALPLFLFACRSNETPPDGAPGEATQEAPPVVETYPGESQEAVTIVGTLALAQAGLTRLPLSTAMEYLTSWESQIDAAGLSNGPALVASLRALRETLQAPGPTDGPAVGRLLLQLGIDTETASAEAPTPEAQAQVRELASALTAAGEALGASRPVAEAR